MGRTNYQRGTEKEYEVIKMFEAVGCEASRTAGSHGTFDVIVRTPVGVRFIQIKRIKKGNSWKSEYEAEVEKIRQLVKTPNISYEYWIWEDYTGWIKQEVII